MAIGKKPDIIKEKQARRTMLAYSAGIGIAVLAAFFYELFGYRNPILFEIRDAGILPVFYLGLIPLMFFYFWLKRRLSLDQLYYFEPSFTIYAFAVFGAPIAFLSLLCDFLWQYRVKNKPFPQVFILVLLIIVLADLQRRLRREWSIAAYTAVVVFLLILFLLRREKLKSAYFLLNLLYVAIPFSFIYLSGTFYVSYKIAPFLIMSSFCGIYLISIALIWFSWQVSAERKKNRLWADLTAAAFRIMHHKEHGYLYEQLEQVVSRYFSYDLFYIGYADDRQTKLDIDFAMEKGRLLPNDVIDLPNSLSLLALKQKGGALTIGDMSHVANVMYRKIRSSTSVISSFCGVPIQNRSAIPVGVMGLESEKRNRFGPQEEEMLLQIKKSFELCLRMISENGGEKGSRREPAPVEPEGGK